MKWLRTPSGGYVDPLEVVAIEALPHALSRCIATLRTGDAFQIDDTPDRVWHAVMDARRSA